MTPTRKVEFNLHRELLRKLSITVLEVSLEGIKRGPHGLRRYHQVIARLVRTEGDKS